MVNDNEIKVRVSLADKQRIKELAGERGMSGFIMDRCLGKPIVREVNPFGAVPDQMKAWAEHALAFAGQTLGEWACDMLDRCMEKQKALAAEREKQKNVEGAT